MAVMAPMNDRMVSDNWLPTNDKVVGPVNSLKSLTPHITVIHKYKVCTRPLS
jgi:hypothetical protein